MTFDLLGRVPVQPLRSRIPAEDRAVERLGDNGVFRPDDERDVPCQRLFDLLALRDVLRRAEHPDGLSLPVAHDLSTAVHCAHSTVRATHDPMLAHVRRAIVIGPLDGLPYASAILGMHQLERSRERVPPCARPSRARGLAATAMTGRLRLFFPSVKTLPGPSA